MRTTFKKTISLVLAVLFLLPGLGVGLTASAQDAVTFSVVPDETTAYPGETITYAVHMGPVSNLNGLQIKLGIPDGLTFKQANLKTKLLQQMSAECPEFSIEFGDSSLTLLIYTISASDQFTSTADGVLMTFTCTVDEGASGAKTIDLPKHIVLSRTGGGTVPTAYDPAGSAVTIMPAPPVKAIELVTGGAAANIPGAQTSAVYFGNYKQSSDGGDGFNVDPVKWRVLSNAEGKLFLLSDQNLDVVRYNESFNPVTWETCTLRKWLNGCDGNPYEDSFIGTAFSDKEAAAIAETAVVNDDNPGYGTPGGSDTTDKVFLLSIAEATDTAYGFTDNYDETDARVSRNTAYVASGGHTGGNMYAVGEAALWWLRSPGGSGSDSSVVDRDGCLYDDGNIVHGGYVAVRPALNVDLNKVLFISAAENGKQGDGLTAVGHYNYYGSEWKLTVLDDSRSDFTAKCTKIENGVYTVQYSGAATGTNEKISAMIVSADGAVTYYGVLEAAKAGENTLTLDVNGKLNDGDRLYVFNEQYNGDKKTDYASALKEIVSPIVSASSLKQGDTFEMGMYPQTRVTDDETIEALNNVSATWQSYDYYMGSGGDYWDGQMTTSDYMQYCDVTLGTRKYRGVRFSQYRPYRTGNIASEQTTYQDDNGYTTNTTYWFLYEPLQWRVLDPVTGLVMCESIIDSQAYNNYFIRDTEKDEHNDYYYWGDSDKTHYPSNYEKSSIRAWLNDDFYTTAFTASQGRVIIPTTLDNSAYDPDFSCLSTTDNVFLPSYSDMVNKAYGFSADAKEEDPARQAFGTDYAKCQGLYVRPSNQNSIWRLRTAYDYYNSNYNVLYSGNVGDSNHVLATSNGIRPAITVDLEALTLEIYKQQQKAAVDTMQQNAGSDACPGVFQKAKDDIDAVTFDDSKTMDENKAVVDAIVTALENGSFDHSYEWIIDTQPGCGTEGVHHEECSVCHAKRNEGTPITPTGNHTYEWIVDTQPGCGTEGVQHEECTSCHATRNENTPIDPTGDHDFSIVHEKVDPTCTAEGYTIYKCSVCGDVDPTHKDIVSANGHTYGAPVWKWAEDYRSATATFTCEKGDDTLVLTDRSPVTTVISAANCMDDKVVTYTASVSLNGTTYTNTTDEITVPGSASDHADEDNDGKCDRCGEKMTGGDHCLLCGRIHTKDTVKEILTKFIHIMIYNIKLVLAIIFDAIKK